LPDSIGQHAATSESPAESLDFLFGRLETLIKDGPLNEAMIELAKFTEDVGNTLVELNLLSEAKGGLAPAPMHWEEVYERAGYSSTSESDFKIFQRIRDDRSNFGAAHTQRGLHKKSRLEVTNNFDEL